MNRPLKILLLEDSEDDADLIQHTLKRGGIKFTALIVDTKVDFIDGVRNFKPDLVLSDHSLPKFNSSEAVKIFKNHLKVQMLSAPFILITGAISEESAMQCIKDGADDYILKDRLQRLPTAIKNALEKCGIENENHKTTAEKLLLLERYEYVTKATSEAIWDWDIVNNSIFCGKGFEKIFGHTAEPGSENNNLNTAYICVDDIERVVTGMDNAIVNQENQWCDEYKYLKANGDFAFVQDNAVIIRNEDGKAIRMIGAIRDITTKKKEDLRLKLLESVVTNTIDGVLITETGSLNPASFKTVYVNEAFTKMTGFTNEDVIGKTPFFLQGEKTDPGVVDCLRNALEENEPCHLDMISYKKNGEAFWIHFSATPISTAHGELSHWVFIQRDINEQRNHIKAIENQNLQLKEIAWIQSHVVRAPLARMMGFINLINSNKDTGAEKTGLLQYVLDSGRELDAIIREIVEKAEKANRI
ncbi:MAG: PAS domain S-box protein [Ferruginibacter sp.]|nr:PAS domain S-box protein [Ferruginibacter sp.]